MVDDLFVLPSSQTLYPLPCFLFFALPEFLVLRPSPPPFRFVPSFHFKIIPWITTSSPRRAFSRSSLLNVKKREICRALLYGPHQYSIQGVGDRSASWKRRHRTCPGARRRNSWWPLNCGRSFNGLFRGSSANCPEDVRLFREFSLSHLRASQ